MSDDKTTVNAHAVMLDHSCDAIDRRDETIARQVAMLDQSAAALDEVTLQHRGAWREVERLRRILRNHGVDFVTGGAS